MRNNKGHGNLSTELRLICLMRAARITGWRRGVRLPGKPDFAFLRTRVAVFVDGCFWHGCSCKRPSKSNRNFWAEKVETNRARDKRVSRQLRTLGWEVIRLWEHELRRGPERVIDRMVRTLLKAKLQAEASYGGQNK